MRIVLPYTGMYKKKLNYVPRNLLLLYVTGCPFIRESTKSVSSITTAISESLFPS